MNRADFRHGADDGVQRKPLCVGRNFFDLADDQILRVNSADSGRRDNVVRFGRRIARQVGKPEPSLEGKFDIAGCGADRPCFLSIARPGPLLQDRVYLGVRHPTMLTIPTRPALLMTGRFEIPSCCLFSMKKCRSGREGSLPMTMAGTKWKSGLFS